LLCALAERTAAAVTRAISEGDPTFFRAANVSAALALMGAERAAVVILGGDSRLAVAASCRVLRAAEACRNAVIVAVGSERVDDVSALIEAGADDFFIETFGQDVLQSRLLVAQHTASQLGRRSRTKGQGWTPDQRYVVSGASGWSLDRSESLRFPIRPAVSA
jgi:DNA-binding response OmpR family regulator